MKTQIYSVLRTTLLPSGDMVEVIMRPIKRGNEQVVGEITSYYTPAQSPKAGDKMIVTVEVEPQKT